MSELHSVLDFPLSIGRKILASVPASSPLAQKPSTSNLNKATLDSDPVIIITVLVCFLILALAFTPLLRYGCRGQTVLDPSDAVADTGLQKAVLKELPIIVYTATSKPPPVPADCPICLAEFAEGENMRVLPKCNHGFHVECIDNWLVSHSSCPMCRHCLNLQSGNKKTRGAAIVQVTESNNSMHIVTEATDSSQAGRAVSPHTETFQRAPQETAVTTPSRLPSPS